MLLLCGLVAAVVFVASLVGIFTRPLGFLAAIWPANGILLGLFVVRPDFARPAGWLAALAGYLLAGVVSGDPLPTNLWLTAANLSGVLIGYWAFRRLSPEDRALQRPLSVLRVLLICVLASAVAGLVACGLAPLLFDRPIFSGVVLWFTTELTNFVMTLPVMLTAPLLGQWARFMEQLSAGIRNPEKTLPILACVLSVASAIAIGGPGAMAFPIPALLWCSLSLGLFPMSIIVLLSSMAMMIAETTGHLVPAAGGDLISSTSSFRIGITLLMMGPFTVTSIALAQKELLRRLDLAVSTDALTGVLTRRAFLEQSRLWLTDWPRFHGQGGMAVLMIDLDHFKQLNDSRGHAVGDAVLVSVTKAIGDALREGDLFGRLGGEEFAISLRDISFDESLALAERLCRRVAALEVVHDAGSVSDITISVGLVHWSQGQSADLGDMLRASDEALYEAKRTGRNRVVVYGAEPSLP